MLNILAQLPTLVSALKSPIFAPSCRYDRGGVAAGITDEVSKILPHASFVTALCFVHVQWSLCSATSMYSCVCQAFVLASPAVSALATLAVARTSGLFFFFSAAQSNGFSSPPPYFKTSASFPSTEQFEKSPPHHNATDPRMK